MILARIALFPLLLLSMQGCVTEGYYAHRGRAGDPSDAVLPEPPFSPRALTMFEGDTGRIATWADLMEGIGWADVILVGEIHDDRTAHEVQLAIFEDTLASHSGTALSLEMFERDEQEIVDAYLAGEIDREALIERTGSRSWGPRDPARGSWEEFYQPLVDAAKAGGAPVIAANAPRRYVRLARTDGFDALKALPPEERAYVALPRSGSLGPYRIRFDRVMSSDGDDPNDPERRATLDGFFRAQLVWDATMADSIVRARKAGATKVVHCVGSFHSDFRGGTWREIRARAPFAKILAVTVIPRSGEALDADDARRADVVIYGFDRITETPVPEEEVEAVASGVL